MKLALVMIVKPSNEEAEVLKRALASAAPHVDGVFLTITGENDACEKVGKAFGAHISHCEWENNFAKARNFALAQVPKDYDYWMWIDCDDVLVGGEKIKPTLEDNPALDAMVLNYLYAFDEWRNPTVVHAKTRVLRHDGCVEWVGALHEDFKKNRKISAKFVEGVFVAHETTDERIEDSRNRNLVVAEADMIENAEDPRSLWNLGNAAKAAGDQKKALTAFYEFLEASKSDDEKYIVHLRMAETFWQMNDMDKALHHARMAVAIRPTFPDAHILCARLLLVMARYEEARESALFGLKLEPQTLKMIVFNPREYDYEPLYLLAKIYLCMSMPQLALPMLEGCLQITPNDERLKELVEKIKEQAENAEKAVEWAAKLREMDDDELREAIEGIDPEIRSHPAICSVRNARLIKTESSGKDVVFYCGVTQDEWNPDIARESGIGGSEEAVIHLSKHFADAGYNVTVYNNCGHRPLEFDGVTFRPYWEWNYRDKQDVVILWRSPKCVDYGINADHIYIDMHDVIDGGEFNEKRLESIDKVFFKSQVHRELYPHVPEEKCVVVQNGIVWGQFQDDSIERDPYLLINTSSPDRSLSTLVEQFALIKKEVPEAKLKWAYGWNVWDTVYGNDPEMVQWKQEITELLEATDGAEALGRIGHDEVAKLYQQGAIFAYPTAFFEIDCISARKAQAAGAVPITTDFAALDETVQHGVKVKTDVERENWDKDGATDYALKQQEAVDAWREAVIAELKNPTKDTQDMRDWTKRFDWSSIAKAWLKHL